MADILKQIKQNSETIRRCQRNWDLSKTIPHEHIQLLGEVAKNSPAKQDEAYFDVYVINDKDLIEELYKNSDGYTTGVAEGKDFEVWPNSQTRANVVFCWSARQPSTMRNYYQDDTDYEAFDKSDTGIDNIKTPGTPKDPDEWSRNIENTYTSMGISMACVAQAAAQLGYVTGFNKNFGDFDEVIELPQTETEYLRYTLGIGYPMENMPHYIDNEGREFLSNSLTTERENKIIEVTLKDGKINKQKLA